MSVDKQRDEARRWLTTAEEDLEAARILLAGGAFSHACFFCQQCGEKAVKALWLWLGGDPWGHSVQKLIEGIPDPEAQAALGQLLEEGAALDRCYVPTRYPNGLPDLTPGKCYFRSDAETCLASAQRIVEAVRERLATS
jgi:HEPN domain-containing protein